MNKKYIRGNYIIIDKAPYALKDLNITWFTLRWQNNRARHRIKFKAI